MTGQVKVVPVLAWPRQYPKHRWIPGLAVRTRVRRQAVALLRPNGATALSNC